MTELRYPLGEDGYPVPNYVMAAEPARPHFRPGPVLQSSDVPSILVIGAGYTGLAAALRLAELSSFEGQAARILLLERDHVAAGPLAKVRAISADCSPPRPRCDDIAAKYWGIG